MRFPERSPGTTHRLPQPLVWLVSVLTVAAVIDDLRRVVSALLGGDLSTATLIRLAVLAAVCATGLSLALRPRWAPWPFLVLVVLMFGLSDRYTLQVVCFLVLALASVLLDLTRLLLMVLPYTAALIAWISVVPGPPPLFQIAHVLALITVVSLGRLLRVAVDRNAAEKRENEEQVKAAIAREEAMQQHSLRLTEQHREQRRVLSHELHDVVAHELTRMTMQASVQAQQAPDAASRDAFADLAAAGRRGLGEMRRLMAIITDEAPDGETPADPASSGPPDVPRPQVTSAVSLSLRQSAQYLEDLGMRVQVHQAGDESRLSPSLRSTAAGVLREGCTNIAKHGTPGLACELRAVVHTDRLELTVLNDLGRGGADLPPSGFGLSALRSRVEALGGQLRVGPQGGRWRLSVHLPLEAPSSGD